MTQASDSFDLVCIGRVGVDLYPMQVGVGLDDITQFGKFLGGSAANVAVAGALYGRRSALISGVGADPFGRFVRRELRALGVDDQFVVSAASLRTPVTFCEIFPPDNFPLYFYRGPDAPDLRIDEKDVPVAEVAAARVYWSTLTGLSQEPSRRAHALAWRRRGRRPLTVLDLDYRAMFWSGGESQARGQARQALGECTVAVGNREECRIATGETEPMAAAEKLLALGASLAVVKLGSDGALAMSASGTWTVPGLRVPVVNGLGAGDAFGGALCHGLLAGWPIEDVLRFANAAGALVATRLECSAAMPTEHEVRQLMARSDW